MLKDKQAVFCPTHEIRVKILKDLESKGYFIANCLIRDIDNKDVSAEFPYLIYCKGMIDGQKWSTGEFECINHYEYGRYEFIKRKIKKLWA